MISFIGFVVVLIPLVVVHELGHFLFAKLFGVRADAFSVGFGPVLWKKSFGETEFRLSAIPLGGYVKLLGEDPTAPLSDEERKRALHSQVPWKRFFIFFGGPLFNFVWAALVFMVMMVIGEQQVATVVGRVLPETPAATAGLRPGDKILSVAGEPVSKFEELIQKISDRPATEVVLEVERGTERLSLKAQTGTEDGFSMYGENKPVGNLDGLIPSGRSGKIGVSSPVSPAGKAGLKTGDELVSFMGKALKSYEEFEASYAGVAPPYRFEVKSDQQVRSIVLEAKNTGNPGADLGLFSSELFVDQAVKDSPAEKIGIRKGDQLVAVNAVPIRSFFELRKNIQKAGEVHGKLNLTVVRDGKTVTYEVIPSVTTERDPMLKTLKQYTVGVIPVSTMLEPEMVVERVLNPFVLVYRGVARMIDLSARNLVSIGKMIQGQVSVKSLGGPILIGKLAGDSISRGLMDFLRMMAILSIGLGVLNILPIPVLDGGHIVLLGIEAIRGRALSLKQLEIAQTVGLVFILLIMVVVMKNDISRLPIFN